MKLFSAAQIDKINAIAAKSNESLKPAASGGKPASINDELNQITKEVLDYFKDSPAILIKNAKELHDYVDKCIEAGYAGIDTETTGLDRIRDKIVGASLYYPGGVECYIPSCHLLPIFEKPYPNQLTYDVIGQEFHRLADNHVRLIFANADFDLAMIYKDLKVDLVPACFFDVILAWRCLREDEKDNTLKGLYAKYVMKGQIEAKKFRDFFSPKLFPYSKPEVAGLYAANDAKITYELFVWELQYITKSNPKCQKNHLEKIADLIWNVEMPMIRVCAHLHRVGVRLDTSVIPALHERYSNDLKAAQVQLAKDIQHLIDERDVPGNRKRPFRTGADFNANSQPHVKYLLNTLLALDVEGTGKEVLNEVKDPSAKDILQVRKGVKLLGTYIDKMPNIAGPDGRVHCTFKSIGADTGRMASADPNLQNIPSKMHDIRHMFRASNGYVMMSSDFSQQEPKLTAFCTGDQRMIETFQTGKDIYATLASIGLGFPYEECLEFNPITHENQPEGKARRGTGKILVLGINYGMSTFSIADMLFGDDDTMTQEEKMKKAEKIQQSLTKGFPQLQKAIADAQIRAAKVGYTETILGRRRHHPDMQLPKYEFKPMKGYINPDVDPLDPSTLTTKEQIPQRIINQLTKEFNGYKYYGQRVKRTKELAEEKIKVIDNTYKISTASREVFNCVDKSTEILTTSGWKKWNEVSVGDAVLSYSVDRRKVETDVVTAVHIYDEPAKVIDFGTLTFSASSTPDHRWVVQDSSGVVQFKTTQDIYSSKWPDYQIIRVGDNNFEEGQIADIDLKALGSDPKKLTFDLVSTLSQRQCNILMRSMLQCGGEGESLSSDIVSLCFESKGQVDIFQYLAFRAGYASDAYETSSAGNKRQYRVCILESKTRRLCSHHKSSRMCDGGVWCVSTSNRTWVARRNGTVYITGNSIIQGSAADVTKLAMLNLTTDPEWEEIGGRFLIPVHDELIVEVPFENREKGAQILSRNMEKAGSFLPFPLKCDVETTFRWYGLGVDDILSFDKPTSLDVSTMSESNIKWIQCMLIENEFIMPKYPHEDGSKLIGLEAEGVNGRWSDEMSSAIRSYCNRYSLQDDQFLDHIEKKVIWGEY